MGGGGWLTSLLLVHLEQADVTMLGLRTVPHVAMHIAGPTTGYDVTMLRRYDGKERGLAWHLGREQNKTEQNSVHTGTGTGTGTGTRARAHTPS